MIKYKITAAALAAATALTFAATANAAPVTTGATVLKHSVSSDVEQVRWRGGGRAAAAAGIGLATGAIIGGAIASSNRGYYYGEPYGYGGGYAYEPGYYAAPAPRYYNRGYYGCDRVDSSGVTKFDNCY